MIVARVIIPFLITSLSANAGIIGDGLTNLPILAVARHGWGDGAQIVNYHGPVGATNSSSVNKPLSD